MKTEKALEQYCDMMVQTIEGLQQGWKQTWFTGAMAHPTNIDGKRYNGINVMWLWMTAQSMGWQYPVYVTFKRAKELGAHVKKGEKATPVFFWKLIGKNDMGKYVDAKELTSEDKVFPVLRTFDVFNVEQTNLAESNPKRWEKLVAEYGTAHHDASAMYANDELDKLISGQWLCPVIVDNSGKACYNKRTDTITLPGKEMFGGDPIVAGQEYYAAALHEMAHSTGHKSRLDRLDNSEYGREELVAELTAAVCGSELGFVTAVQENNAAYLKEWLKLIKQEPKFLLSVLADVNKACAMINAELNK